MSKRYLTTPLYYVNDSPHIGHAYTTLAADILARHHRLRGRAVFFLTGTDEHGQKVAQAATACGRVPLAHADALVVRFQQLWQALGISHDDFIRTTEKRHRSVAGAVLQQLYDRGEIYADDYQGWYCLPDERFWTEKELVDGACPDCHRPVTPIAERNYFFRMGKYQARLIEHIERHPQFIRPEGRRNEVLGFLKKPLGDLCISRPLRRLAWGIPLPFDADYVTYVWVDALVNYISAVSYATDAERFRRLWPCDLHLVGKDILTPHAVYWATLLMALDLPLPVQIFAHGWWTMDGEKMTKSRGNVVDPSDIVREFGAEAFRYFLFREVPFGQDGNFSRTALIGRYNGDLANDLGNLVSRTASLILQRAGGVIPPPAADRDDAEGEAVRQSLSALSTTLDAALDDLAFHQALDAIWDVVDRLNRYIEQKAPWSLAKQSGDEVQLQTVLYTVAEGLRLVALHLSPFLPKTAEAIHRTLGLADEACAQPFETQQQWGGVSLVGRRVVKGAALFPRIEKNLPPVVSTDGKNFTSAAGSDAPVKQEAVPSTATEPQILSDDTHGRNTPAPSWVSTEIKPQILIDDFARLDLRVGRILEAERVTGSKKLLKLQVDIGTEIRQVLAGIGMRYTPEALIGKQVAVLVNLKPAKMMGIESQGMLLAAGEESVLGLTTFLEEIPLGSRIR